MLSWKPLKLLAGLNALLLILLVSMLVYKSPNQQLVDHKRQIASRLLLTDYCLSTESRHTRHISMPEWLAPFQDVPGFHDHFPSSSFMRPILPKPDSSFRLPDQSDSW